MDKAIGEVMEDLEYAVVGEPNFAAKVILAALSKTLEHAKVHLKGRWDDWRALRFYTHHLKARQNALHGTVIVPACSKVLLHIGQMVAADFFVMERA